MNLKAWILILFITSIPFIAMEFVSPGFGVDSLFGGGDTEAASSQILGSGAFGNVSSQAFWVCYMKPELPCTVQNLSQDGFLKVRIFNEFDSSIVVSEIGCSKGKTVLPCGSSGTGMKAVCDPLNQTAKSVRLRPGDSNDFLVQCSDAGGSPISLSKGETFQGTISLEYYKDEGSLGKELASGAIIQDAG